MFTGLVQKNAVILERSILDDAGKLTLAVDQQFENLILGESIAINGTCLTLEKYNDSQLTFHVLKETFIRTNLGQLEIGQQVNMERALAVGDRLGGHIVSGHIDSTAQVLSWVQNGSDWVLTIELPENISNYLIEKGSIAVDGISLTIAALYDNSFDIHLIPTTLAETALKARKVGALVNLEADMIGKYIERQMSAWQKNQQTNNITMNDLINAGW
jgi:riboflavin synthase